VPLPLKIPPLALLLEAAVRGTLPPPGDEVGLLGVRVEELAVAPMKASVGVTEGEAPVERVPEGLEVGEGEAVAVGVVEGDAPFDSV
jgi:hypothetical protein